MGHRYDGIEALERVVRFSSCRGDQEIFGGRSGGREPGAAADKELGLGVRVPLLGGPEGVRQRQWPEHSRAEKSSRGNPRSGKAESGIKCRRNKRPSIKCRRIEEPGSKCRRVRESGIKCRFSSAVAMWRSSECPYDWNSYFSYY